MSEFESPPVGDDGIAAAFAQGRPAMIVERPDVFGSREAPAPLEVSGWAWSGAGIESVVVIVDGDVEIEALHDLFRPDLRKLLGDQRATSGFAVWVDPRDWTPGPHQLTIVATDLDGRRIGVSGQVQSVPAPPPPSSPDGQIDALPDDIADHERFDPSVHRGHAVAPEHYARYQWAAGEVAGINVLDAGCGLGWGTALLAQHAHQATGIDLSPRAIATAQQDHGHAATFHEGDLLDLPFDDDQFDAIVCFEAIEHVKDTDRALDELHRVLTPNGLLLISSPNRGIYPQGNPFHLNELTSDELATTLQARFANVAIHRQQTYIASLLCDDQTLQQDNPHQPIPTTTTKITATTPGNEPYTIATATNGQPPNPPTQLTLGTTAVNSGLEMWRERAVRAEIDFAVSRTETFWEGYVGNESILEAIAREKALKQRLTVLDREREAAHEALAALRRSMSWRLTAAFRETRRRRRLREP